MFAPLVAEGIFFNDMGPEVIYVVSTSTLSEEASPGWVSGDIQGGSSLVGSDCSSAETPASDEYVDNVDLPLPGLPKMKSFITIEHLQHDVCKKY